MREAGNEAMFDHFHEHLSDLLVRVATGWFVPLRKPVAHPKQTKNNYLRVEVRLENASRLTLQNDLFEELFEGFHTQDNFFGKWAGKVGLISVKHHHGRYAVSGHGRIV